MSTTKKLDEMSRFEKEKLLETLVKREKVRQQSMITGYNNPMSDFLKREAKKQGKKPEDLVHKIQLGFHKDPKKIRLFLGGNRCLAKGTYISGPNGTRTKIEDLKSGDVVLAVDPDTRATLPVPVEEVFNNGKQECFLFQSKGWDGFETRSIWSTPNHHILTERGLEEIGDLEAGAIAHKPLNLHYGGNNPPVACVLGYLISGLSFEGDRPTVNLTKKEMYQVKKLIWDNHIDGYVRELKNGKIGIFGSILKYLSTHAKDPRKLYQHINFNYNLDGLSAFLGGVLTRKYVKNKHFPMFYCQDSVEVRRISAFLKALGIYSSISAPTNQRQDFMLIIGNPHDVNRLCDLVSMPLIEKRLRKWAESKLDMRAMDAPKFLKQESYWRIDKRIRETKSKFIDTYDLKLSGGHNLYVADGFVVGNSGKTEAGAVEAYWFMSGTHPYRDNIPVPNVGRVLAESLDHFEADIVPKFRRWAPNFSKWKPIKGHQGKTAGYILPNGSKFYVFTHQQDFSKLEGTSFYWLWANEPPPQSHVNASMRGLVDQNGQAWFTLTPLSEPYLYNDYALPAKTGEKTNIGLHECSIWENPWLDPEAISQFLESLDPEERIARESGEFKFLTGRVYKTFDPMKHVIPNGNWPSTWPISIGIDPHLRKNHVAMFLGHSRKGWYVAVDELASAGDLEEFGDAIVKRVVDSGYYVQSICADSFLSQPDMLRRDIEPRIVLDRIFEEAGLPMITIAKKKNTRDAFISEMKRLLADQNWPQYNQKGPGFYVMARCQNLVKEFLNYVYKESRRPEIQGVSEEPAKVWDDFLDALKYAFIADPLFVSRMKSTHVPSLSYQTYGGK